MAARRRIFCIYEFKMINFRFERGHIGFSNIKGGPRRCNTMDPVPAQLIHEYLRSLSLKYYPVVDTQRVSYFQT